MLLLDRYFFFASDFCRHVIDLARDYSDKPYQADWSVHVLPYEAIGNMQGSITGTDLSGFIGAVHRIFPFPKDLADFKQNPEGYAARERIEALATTFVPVQSVPAAADPNGEFVAIGEYVFNRPQFQALLVYVWLGGYPRWKDTVRPDYVLEMAAAVKLSDHPLFVDISAALA